MTVCRGTITLRRQHFVTWQSNARSQARAARKAEATTSVLLPARKLVASNENRFSASSCRNLRTSTNTDTGAECIWTGLPTPERKNDAHAPKRPATDRIERVFSEVDRRPRLAQACRLTGQCFVILRVWRCDPVGRQRRGAVGPSAAAYAWFSHRSGWGSLRSVPLMWRLARLEWVYNSDAQLLEVAFASRSDDQVMNARRGSNHGIFQESIRSPVH
jgi:hypothetical protein